MKNSCFQLELNGDAMRCLAMVAIIACFIVPASAGYASLLTEAEAISRAVSFCNRVGVPITLNANAAYPAPNRFAAEQDSHWQARWRVRFGNGTEVDVADGTSIVTWCSNPVLYQTDKDRRAGLLLSRDQAIARATEILLATGQERGVDFLDAQLTSNNAGELALDNAWYVRWDRMLQGIPYRYQGVNITIQADTGALRGMSVTFPTPPIKPFEFHVNSARAGATAIRFADGRVPPEYTPATIQASILPVNDFWLHPELERATSGALRPVWVARFRSFATTYDIWVDIETGSVVGGTRGSIGAVRYPRDDGVSTYALELARNLSASKEVRIFRRGSHGLWEKRPFAIVDDRSAHNVLGLMTHVAVQDGKPPKRFADMKALVVGPGGSVTEYAYDSATNVIGGRGTWVSVPSDFQAIVARSAR